MCGDGVGCIIVLALQMSAHVIALSPFLVQKSKPKTGENSRLRLQSGDSSFAARVNSLCSIISCRMEHLSVSHFRSLTSHHRGLLLLFGLTEKRALVIS